MRQEGALLFARRTEYRYEEAESTLMQRVRNEKGQRVIAVIVDIELEQQGQMKNSCVAACTWEKRCNESKTKGGKIEELIGDCVR